MSCQPLWERIIELAEQARKEALGADAATSVRNTDLVRAELEQIDKQCGNQSERAQKRKLEVLEDELENTRNELSSLRSKVQRISEICDE